MTRVEIERRLHVQLLAVHVAGMASTAVARERELEAATENVLNAVETILREVKSEYEQRLRNIGDHMVGL